MKKTISPEMATALLSNNNINRPLSHQTVTRYSRLLTRREWKYNGEAIKVSITGQLIDGQHRLHAIVASGVPMVTEFIDHLVDDVFDTVDVGKGRSTADIFAINGIPNACKVASSIPVCISLLEMTNLQGVKHEKYEQYNFYDRNKYIFDQIDYGKKYLGAPISVVNGVIAYLLFFNNTETVLEFFDSFSSGEYKRSNQPLVLRDTLIKAALNDKVSYKKKELAARILKAFKNSKKGLTPKSIRWDNTRQGKPSVFPYDDGHYQPIVIDGDIGSQIVNL